MLSELNSPAAYQHKLSPTVMDDITAVLGNLQPSAPQDLAEGVRLYSPGPQHTEEGAVAILAVIGENNTTSGSYNFVIAEGGTVLGGFDTGELVDKPLELPKTPLSSLSRVTEDLNDLKPIETSELMFGFPDLEGRL